MYCNKNTRNEMKIHINVDMSFNKIIVNNCNEIWFKIVLGI